jgi:Family of unknown function (DUF5681)
MCEANRANARMFSRRLDTASRPRPRGSSPVNPAIRKAVPRARAISSRPSTRNRLKKLIIAEAYRTIKATEGNRQITIPMVQAILRSLATKAARSDHRAQQKFTELLSETERANKAQKDELLNTAMKYKFRWEEELERRKKLGITGPEPLPHPDDIIFDMKTDQVIIKGPRTKEEKVLWDEARELLKARDREIEKLTALLKDSKTKTDRRFLRDDILHQRRLRDIIVNAIGEPRRDDVQ